MCRIDRFGALSPEAVTPTPKLLFGVAVDVAGRFVYGTTFGEIVLMSAEPFWVRGEVHVFTIDSTTGLLTAGTSFGWGDLPGGVALGSSGGFAYLTNHGTVDRESARSNGMGTVLTLGINQATGALTVGASLPLPTVAGSAEPEAPGAWSVDPSGRFAYVQSAADLMKFSINQGSGALTAMGPEAAAAGRPITILSVVQ
jgi:DNA-binding beta-propeller fold protein YncE